jgi:hypothetical protein
VEGVEERVDRELRLTPLSTLNTSSSEERVERSEE